jgi:DNA-binding PadR family transcriptional regulator
LAHQQTDQPSVTKPLNQPTLKGLNKSPLCLLHPLTISVSLFSVVALLYPTLAGLNELLLVCEKKLDKLIYPRTIYPPLSMERGGKKRQTMKNQPEPEKLLPLTPAVFHILLALADGDKHGYGIMREVAERTKGQMRMGPGTLYGSIKRMMLQQLIEEADERPDPELDDERRRYYRLTNFGQRVAVAETKRVRQLVGIAQDKRLLGGGKLSAAFD